MKIGIKEHNRYVYATHRPGKIEHAATVLGRLLAALFWSVALLVYLVLLVASWPAWLAWRLIQRLVCALLAFEAAPKRWWG